MLITEHQTNTSEAMAKSIWERWSNPASWPAWDPDISAVSFDGAFVVGGTGTLKPMSGPKVHWTLESVEPGRSFTTVAKLPGAKARFIHELREEGKETVVRHAVEIDGWSTPLIGRLLGPKLAPNLRQAVETLAANGTDFEPA